MKRREHARVVVGIDDHPHRLEVLRGRAKHAGAADVDVLDRLLGRDALPRDRLAERIQIHRDEIDRLNSMLGDCRHVLGNIAPREQSAVNRGVQRLHSAVHHLREARDFADVDRLEAGGAQRSGRAARRNELPSEVGEPSGEFDQAGFIGNRE